MYISFNYVRSSMSTIFSDLVARCQGLVTPGGIRLRGDKWCGYVKVLDLDGTWRQRAHALCSVGDDQDASRATASSQTSRSCAPAAAALSMCTGCTAGNTRP